MLSKCSFGNEDLYHDEFKHLNHMEDQILESMAWRYQSPLFEYMKSCDQPIPSCEEVLLPSQLQLPTPSATPTPVIAQSSDPVRNIPQPIHINQHQSINIYPIPYSPSTYVTNKRAESSLAACNFSYSSYQQFSEFTICFFMSLALLQSPVSSVASMNERTPAQSSRRELFSTGSESISQSPSTAAAAPVNAIKSPAEFSISKSISFSKILKQAPIGNCRKHLSVGTCD